MVNLVPEALVDVAASEGWLGPALHTMLLVQMMVYGCWHLDSSVLTLPALCNYHLSLLTQILLRLALVLLSINL